MLYLDSIYLSLPHIKWKLSPVLLFTLPPLARNNTHNKPQHYLELPISIMHAGYESRGPKDREPVTHMSHAVHLKKYILFRVT